MKEKYSGPPIELAFVNCALHIKVNASSKASRFSTNLNPSPNPDPNQVNARGKASRFGKMTKPLISQISGSVTSGEVLATMGP